MRRRTDEVHTRPETIEAYVSRLVVHLGGSHGWRAHAVAEVRDGLYDLREHNIAAGTDAYNAERTAVSEWGTPETIAAAYRRAVVFRAARRVGWTLLVTVPALVAAWFVVVTNGPPAPWQGGDLTVEVGGRVLGVLLVTTVGAALVAVAASSGVAGLVRDRTARLRRWSGLAIAAFLCALADTAAVLVTQSAIAPHSLAIPGIIAVGGVSIALGGWLVVRLTELFGRTGTAYGIEGT